MTEQEFLDQIDCKFPYHDRDIWKRVVDTGSSISSNAAFAVLEEITRPPRSAATSLSDRMEMVAHWRSGFEHPLAEEVSNLALAQMSNSSISPRQCLTLMDEISRYPGQYAALNVAYFACGGVESKEAEEKWQNISEQWAAQ